MGLNQHIPGLFYDVKADGSRAHRLLAAVENLCVQLFFQLLNHGAQGGLCDPAIFSGFGEMTELIDSKYDSNCCKVIETGLLNVIYRIVLCKDRNYLFDKHLFAAYLCNRNKEK